jgi:hypothetical protein
MRYILAVTIGMSSAYLAACSPTIYDKAGATQDDFNRDFGGCRMYALSIPQVQPPPPLPPTYTANTSYSGSVNGAPVYGSSTTTMQPQAAYNPDMSGVANALRQQNAVQSCMMAHGWTPRSR